MTDNDNISKKEYSVPVTGSSVVEFIFQKVPICLIGIHGHIVWLSCMIVWYIMGSKV